MRGTNPDSGPLLDYLDGRAVDDPLFIARRIVIFASSDVGNADLAVASSCDRRQDASISSACLKCDPPRAR